MLPKNLRLEKVGASNLSACGIGCLKNPKNEGYQRKVQWLEQRFQEGLRCLLFRDGEGKPLGFLEYVPGEYAWRPVDAAGWLFVHCLWVNSRGQKIGGLGSRLIQGCLEEARRVNAIGVAAMVSDGPCMAGKEIFLKNGFRLTEAADRFQLVTRRLKAGPEPRFRPLGSNDSRAQGLEVVYCNQCPMLSKSVHGMLAVATGYRLKLRVTELKSAHDAQCAPSYYGVFNLLWNGRVLADHYVSKTRFRNILREEMLAPAR